MSKIIVEKGSSRKVLFEKREISSIDINVKEACLMVYYTNETYLVNEDGTEEILKTTTDSFDGNYGNVYASPVGAALIKMLKERLEQDDPSKWPPGT